LDAVRRGANYATSGSGASMGRAYVGLMIVVAVMYLTGYFMIEDLLAFFK
jgi:hypothetical protein